MAASDRSGTAALAAGTMAGATSALEKQETTFEQRHWHAVPKSIDVPTTTLDLFRRSSGPVDLMKIDVEGHEAAVLAGGYQTIRSDQPIILIECGHPDHACLDLLQALGYVISDLGNWNFLCMPQRFA